jgi:hypothetical protein
VNNEEKTVGLETEKSVLPCLFREFFQEIKLRSFDESSLKKKRTHC